MIRERADQLVAAAQAIHLDEAQLRAAAQAWLEAFPGATTEDATASLTTVADALTVPHLGVGGFLATACGAALEEGADPEPVSAPLVACIRDLTESALPFHRALASQHPDPEDPEAFERLVSDAPESQGSMAWYGLHAFWRGGIALMSRHPASREALADLAPALAEMGAQHEGAGWLGRMARVLDQEPVLVLEPSTGRGMLASASGLADNFQLNMLLMDQFPRGPEDPPRISPIAASVARGDGPQEVDETVRGVWNLYTWQAIDASGALPAPGAQDTDHWIWNEGTLADVPVFEGRRVVLLGPQSYARSWGASRLFGALPGVLAIQDELGPEAVAEHLGRMGAADR